MNSRSISLFCGLTLVFLTLGLGVVVEGKLFNYCPSPHGVIQSIAVSTCTDKDRFCVFKKNTNVSLEATFVPNYAATSVQVKIIGTVAGVPVPFPVDPTEACGNYGLKCPLATGQASAFQLALPIKPIYPPIPVGVTIKLVDDTQGILACFKFTAKIEN